MASRDWWVQCLEIFVAALCVAPYLYTVCIVGYLGVIGISGLTIQPRYSPFRILPSFESYIPGFWKLLVKAFKKHFEEKLTFKCEIFAKLYLHLFRNQECNLLLYCFWLFGIKESLNWFQVQAPIVQAFPNKKNSSWFWNMTLFLQKCYKLIWYFKNKLLWLLGKWKGIRGWFV